MTDHFIMPDSRKDFIETWILDSTQDKYFNLLESPEGISKSDYYAVLNFNIKEKIQLGATVIELPNGYKKIEGAQIVYYWYEDNHTILLAVEFEKREQALVVVLVGKLNKGQPPYASELYNAVLQDRKGLPYKINAIRLSSDKKLTKNGLDIWKRLFDQGHKISVYDAKSETPGQTFTAINSIDDLEYFFKMHSADHQRWQYVISESEQYWEVKAHFDTRKMRELNNML